MITIMNAPVFKLNGRCTGVDTLVRNKLVSAVCSSNHWSCSENNSNNSWNVNFNDGNLNNNNKNNSNVVRAVSALGEEDRLSWLEAKKGVKFVGTVIKPSRHYTSNRTLGNMVNRIRETDRHCAVMLTRGVTLVRLTKLERMVDSINSYMGFCVHNNSYTIRRNMFRKNFNFWKFCFVSGHFTIVKIRKNFQIRNYLLKKEVNYADNLYRNKTARRRNAPRTGKKTVHYQIPGVRRRRR